MRGYQSYKQSKQYVGMPDKVLSCLSYLTSGMVGFLWLIVTHLQGKSISSFARFHVFQSILLSIIIYIASILLSIIASVMQIIPFLGTLAINLVYYLVQYPIIAGHALVGIILIGLYIYLAVFAITGRYGRVPWISDWVRQMV